MLNKKGKSILRIFLLAVGVIIVAGCSSYTTPGGGAEMSVFAERSFAETKGESLTTTLPSGHTIYETPSGGTIEILKRQPTAKFPANIVTVRVQEAGYISYTNKAYGQGNYSVVTVRDVEKDEDFERLSKLHEIAQLSPLSRLLLPSYLESDKELRQAASRLQADMVLIYTIDTDFLDRDKSTLLSIITLGLGPTIEVRVISTVSALVLDTRTGYVYGIVEETAKSEQTTAAITTQNAFDKLRLKTEREAFEKFLDEFEVLWKNIVQQYRK